MLAGWITTEVGRQPWVVYGVLRTADAVTRHSVAELSLSLALFVVIYFAVFGAGIRYLLRLIAAGPGADGTTQVTGGPGQSDMLCGRSLAHRILWVNQEAPLRRRLTNMGIDLPLIWAVVILFGVMAYVMMDGFDLGIGLLFPFVADKDERDVMMNTVARSGTATRRGWCWGARGYWWISAGVFGDFECALSTYRLHAARPYSSAASHSSFGSRRASSIVTGGTRHSSAVDRGGLLSRGDPRAYIDGIPVVERGYAGGALDWLTPFSLFTGMGLCVAYALLGGTWLILKTGAPCARG